MAEKVVSGEILRLMIKVPPGSAKSTYFSVLFPPSVLARRTNFAVLAASHTTDLAESFGRKARNLIDQYPTELGYALASHSKAAGRWETTNGCSYLAAGVGTAIAGYRADLGLIDDPIGKREDADSKLVRDAHWDWWNFDFKTRLKPNAAVIFIYTPWHEDDLGHRVLAAEGLVSNGGLWHEVRMPFFAEDNDVLGRQPGDMLWPEWYKKEMFPTDPRVASALFQLRPAPESGDFFKREWIREYKGESELPKNLRIYIASDHAVSTKETADKTLLVPFGVDKDDNIWILPDYVWERFDTNACVEHMIALATKHQPVCWFAGKEHITASIGPFLQKRMTETGSYFNLNEIVAKKDKQTRCQAIRGRMAMGKVYFPGFGPKWHEARHELLSFPVGTHDEWPDVLGLTGLGLQSLSIASVVQPEPVLNEKKFVPTFSWLKSLEKKPVTARYGDR